MQKKSVTKILLIIMILFFWFAQYVYIPYHTPYLLSLGVASSFVGIIVGAYGLAQVLFRVPIGIFADTKAGQKKLILIGLACAAVASSIRILFPTPAAFLVANFITGVTSATWVSVTVFFSSLFEPGELKKAMGLSIAGNNGGILLGFIASAYISGNLGMTLLFAASIISAVCGIITLLFIKESGPERQTTNKIDFISILKNPSLLFFSFLGLLLQAVVFSTSFSFTTSYAKLLSATDFELALCMIIFILLSVAASLMIGYAKRWSSKTMFIFLFGCFVVYCVGLPCCTAMWQLHILQAVCGIANGGIMSLAMACAMEGAKDGCRSTTMAVFQACYGIGMTLGPILMGVLVDGFGYTAGFLSIAVLSAVGIIAVMMKMKGNAFISNHRTK